LWGLRGLGPFSVVGLERVVEGPAGDRPLLAAGGLVRQAFSDAGHGLAVGAAARRDAHHVLGDHRRGLTNRQIGERMFLAGKAVKNYASAQFAKPWGASLINRLAPIWEQGTDVGSIKGRYPSDPAPGLGKRAGDRVAPGLSGTVG
jgi:hypothetical protein